MIPCVCWVPKGAAKSVPEHWKGDEVASEVKDMMQDLDLKVKEISQDPLDEDEKQKQKNEEEEEEDDNDNDDIIDSESEPQDDDDEDIENASSAPAAPDAIDDVYNLDAYDDDDDEGGILGVNDASFFEANQNDPYITVKEEDDEDLEDLTIRPGDALLLAACTEDEDWSHLDIHVYEEGEDNMYVHHDFLLSAYPLCLAWLNFRPKTADERGNFVAVGTFNPGIEIWDLDLLDCVEPVSVLGGVSIPPIDNGGSTRGAKNKNKRKKKNIKPALKPGSHTDAVMSLAWNKQHRNVLASGGADSTVKLWDLTQETCLQTYKHHKDKVQALEWHPIESNVLLSGGYDKRACVMDVRTPGAVASFPLSADVENLSWHPFQSKYFLVSTEDGKVTCFSIENTKKPIFVLQAHDNASSILAMNKKIPNLMATVSSDKSLKLWDISNNQPKSLFSKEMKKGNLFAVSFYEDSPYLLAISGKKGMDVVDISKIDSIKALSSTSSHESTT